MPAAVEIDAQTLVSGTARPVFMDTASRLRLARDDGGPGYEGPQTPALRSSGRLMASDTSPPVGRVPAMRPSKTEALAALGRRLAGPVLVPAPPSPFDRLDIACLVLALVGVIGAAGILLDPIGFDALDDWSALVWRLAEDITTFGNSGIYLVPLGIMLLAGPWLPLAGRRARAALDLVWLRLAFLFVAIAGTGLTANVVKRLIGRIRPHHLDGSAILQFDPFAWKAAAASFPSGHATTAWCVAVGLGLMLGRKSYPTLAVCAVLVCASRVVLGAHFVSDVIAGGLFGGLTTLWFARFLATRRLVFCFSGQGALALRGPGAAKTLRAFALRRGAGAP